MTALITTIHIVVSVALILIVLLQTGKGASMGAVFGGAGSQTLFGNTGAASFLGKLTTWAAVIFMITSLSLAYISKSGGKSVVSDIQPTTKQTQAPVSEKAPAPEKSLPVKEPGPATTGQPAEKQAPGSADTEQPPADQPAAMPVDHQAQKAVESGTQKMPAADAPKTPVAETKTEPKSTAQPQPGQ